MQKKRNHRLFDNHTILGLILLILGSEVVLSILGGILGILITMATGNENVGSGIGIVVVSLLMLVLYRFWFRPEFEGNLIGGDPKLGIKLGLIIIAYWILVIPALFLSDTAVFGPPTVSTVAMAVMAGMSEETVFRGLSLSYLMRQWRKEEHVMRALIITAIIFGVVHLFNIMFGGNTGSVILQTVSATAIGLFLGAIFLRCGNLLVTMVIHTIHDIIAFLDVGGVKDGVVVASVNMWSFIDLGLSVILGVVGLWMIRPSKRAEIRALWDRKWNITSGDGEETEVEQAPISSC